MRIQNANPCNPMDSHFLRIQARIYANPSTLLTILANQDSHFKRIHMRIQAWIRQNANPGFAKCESRGTGILNPVNPLNARKSGFAYFWIRESMRIQDSQPPMGFAILRILRIRVRRIRESCKSGSAGFANRKFRIRIVRIQDSQ